MEHTNNKLIMNFPDSFEEAKEAFMNQIMKFDFDDVLKGIWECMDEWEFKQGDITIDDIIDNLIIELGNEIEERGKSNRGYAYVETPPYGWETLTFNWFNSSYHFSISKNCFEMRNPNDRYFFEVMREDEETGECEPYFYIELKPSI